MAAAKSDTLWELLDVFQGLPPVPASFGRLATDRTIRADLNVRIGGTYLRLARPDLADPFLRRALTETADVYLLFLANLFLARGAEARDRFGDAEAHYRRALEHVPNAQSAAIPLAALLFEASRIREANDLTTRLLAQNPPAGDPWRMYQSGDARHLPAFIALLRQELK